MKKNWLLRVGLYYYSTQLCGDDNKTIIRIPIEQPGFNGSLLKLIRFLPQFAIRIRCYFFAEPIWTP